MTLKKKYLFKGTYLLLSMKTLICSPDSSKCGVPSVGQFDKNLGQHLIEILFREIRF